MVRLYVYIKSPYVKHDGECNAVKSKLGVKANHPKPGAFVRGITRIGYVPDNNEGRQVCAMLAVAFQRRLVFTIGSSRTTGEEGVITWNDIHHKTDLRPNTQYAVCINNNICHIFPMQIYRRKNIL